jgi:2'-5' RNA ligase
MTLRVFAAVVPPEDVIEHLEAFLEPRRESAPDFRWTLPDQLHITLAFMASVREEQVDDYIDRFADGLARTPVPVLRLAGPATFPDTGATRALATGVVAESEGADVVLERVAGRARNAAVNVGIEVGGGRFRPHCTIARLRRPEDTTSWVRLLETYTGPEWPVIEVAVVASHLGEGPGKRPRYETLAELPLGQ